MDREASILDVMDFPPFDWEDVAEIPGKIFKTLRRFFQ